MLRLDLKDANSTVLFINPMNGAKIRKESDYELCIETDTVVCYASYNLKEHCDEAYWYVLNKINEYLFPQIEPDRLKPIFGNIKE